MPTFTASLDRVVAETIRYDWTVSAGTIVEGQGTPTIKVDIRGTTAQVVTATLDVVGLMNLCKHRASCSTMLYEHLPMARLLDVYYPKSIGAAAPKKTRRRRKTIKQH